jgi:hypothetical protein
MEQSPISSQDLKRRVKEVDNALRVAVATYSQRETSSRHALVDCTWKEVENMKNGGTIEHNSRIRFLVLLMVNAGVSRYFPTTRKNERWSLLFADSPH